MIRSVKISNWKGYEKLKLSFGEGINFLVGPNGIGKTSVLDAISFALLGDLGASPIYKNHTYKDLIRDHQLDMEISLVFSPLGKGEYVVNRYHTSETNRGSSSLSSNGSVLTRRWNETTEMILDLYETNDLFLRRVVLLSEGDTFAYSTQPPGEGLTRHIENVLSINRMESLRNNLRDIRRSFEIEANDRKEKLKETDDIVDEDKEKIQQLSTQLLPMQTERDQLSESVGKLNKQLGSTNAEIQSKEDLITTARSVVDEWSQAFGDLPQDLELKDAAKRLQKSLENERKALIEKRDSVRDELTWLTAQEESQNQILELIEPLKEDHIEVPCPVCKRPLTFDMVTDIKNESKLLLSEFVKRKEEKKKNLIVSEQEIQTTEDKQKKLSEIESKISLVLKQEPKSLSLPVLDAYLNNLVEQKKSIEAQLDIHKKQIAEKEDDIRSIERGLGELQVKVSDKERLDRVRELTSSTKGIYISELFLNSLVSALDVQRTTMLEPLTQELSLMWSAFLGIEVDVQIKNDAQLRMVDPRTGSSLDFPQLSGGEKTALLIFSQILMCKYFSKADFMLLDEPLEHLDAKNRWALIKFLVDTTKRGYPKQLIVTTFEETLLREYLDDEEIKITMLSKVHPVIEVF